MIDVVLAVFGVCFMSIVLIVVLFCYWFSQDDLDYEKTIEERKRMKRFHKQYGEYMRKKESGNKL